MLYFKINRRYDVIAINDGMPAELKANFTLWLRHLDNNGTGWITCDDLDTMMFAQLIADAATAYTSELYIATDNGEWVSPRYEVIKAPKVGDQVSKAFNGDYYPVGVIASISKSLKVIETSTGLKFYRRKLRGAWINAGTWSLVPGHIQRWNPEF
ncbi:hypothetical protein UFOVP728_31 [uncultured Caudovirales phage]|uniref:EF-hand domain-containing protein n=1 Tax=uncultured Caudovirales phage TaxID=2100421 RepID=A0A6J5P0V5_9CAUD|nr:hypothetical protein UFOVP728_31 [uncultured Caudovirales phage]